MRDPDGMLLHWWEQHENLATLLSFLRRAGIDHDPVRVVEKPWHWEAEYRAAQAELVGGTTSV